jgi:hypothetical protein
MPLDVPFQTSTFHEPRKWIKGVCINPMAAFGDDEEWPKLFQYPPREGEFVESASGRTLKVIKVSHAIEEGVPIVYYELGRDLTSSTPTEGAGQDVTVVME